MINEAISLIIKTYYSRNETCVFKICFIQTAISNTNISITTTHGKWTCFPDNREFGTRVVFMARGNFRTIRTVITMEKRLLIGLVVALIVASASWAWGDTVNWPFTTAGNYTVSDATKVEVADGVAKLIAVDQTDNDNTSTGFGGGTHNQTR